MFCASIAVNSGYTVVIPVPITLNALNPFGSYPPNDVTGIDNICAFLPINEAEKVIKPAINFLIKNKCKKIILACTELPVAIFAYKSFKKVKSSKIFLDPNLILAKASMKKYKS